MSRENVKFALDGYARYNAGERRPDLWFWHADAEYHVSCDLWVRFSGHGAGSGLAIEMQLAHALTFAEGRVQRAEEFTNRAEALKSVGLAE